MSRTEKNFRNKNLRTIVARLLTGTLPGTSWAVAGVCHFFDFQTGVHVSVKKTRVVSNEQQRNEVATPHQPGEAVFKAILSEDVDWQPFAAFPPSVRLAILVGQPTAPGPYVIRVKMPSGVKLMPHKHQEDRVYTVISGVFYIGRGDQFDEDKLEAYPPGSLIVLPGNTWHFHWAKSGEYVTQVTAIGPLSLEYLNLNDDPRRKDSLEDTQ